MDRSASMVVLVMVSILFVSCSAWKDKSSGGKFNDGDTMESKSRTLAIPLGEKSVLKVGIERLKNNPIIKPGMDERMGSNINGPSMIRVPDWVENPLGKYYLYFANHKGRYIRLAYADRPEGPWKIHEPGCLQLEESHFLTEPPEITESMLERKPRLDKPRAPNVPSQWEDLVHPHIASPDVLVIEELKEIRMYYHGLEKYGRQYTRVAVSKDGLNFTAQEKLVAYRPYMRVFPFKGEYYAMTMPGFFFRSKDGLTGFQKGPQLFNLNMRHAALMMVENHLLVFWSQVEDAPEHIMLSVIDMGVDFDSLKESRPVELLRPEYDWEGADQPVAESFRSSVNVLANQLRDPAVFRDGDRTYLLYAIGGEAGIGIAELHLELVKP